MKDFIHTMQGYSKFWVALVAALVQAGIVLSDTVTPNTITTSEWIMVAVAFATAMGVYGVANRSAK